MQKFTKQQLAKANRILDEYLRELNAPLIRKELLEWMGQPLVIRGKLLVVRTTVGAWLRALTTAHEAGWQPQTLEAIWMPEVQTVDAAEAGRLAAALG
jgi:hypothetical protein